VCGHRHAARSSCSTTHAVVGSVAGVYSFSLGFSGISWGAVGGRIVLPLLVSPFLALILVEAILGYERLARRPQECWLRRSRRWTTRKDSLPISGRWACWSGRGPRAAHVNHSRVIGRHHRGWSSQEGRPELENGSKHDAGLDSHNAAGRDARGHGFHGSSLGLCGLS